MLCQFGPYFFHALCRAVCHAWACCCFTWKREVEVFHDDGVFVCCFHEQESYWVGGVLMFVVECIVGVCMFCIVAWLLVFLVKELAQGVLEASSPYTPLFRPHHRWHGHKPGSRHLRHDQHQQRRTGVSADVGGVVR